MALLPEQKAEIIGKYGRNESDISRGSDRSADGAYQNADRALQEPSTTTTHVVVC